MSGSVPRHLAIIPDGNRRWARAKGLPTLEGHRRGVDVAKTIAKVAFDRGVEYFTMYAFSTENWQRQQQEVGYLMDLWYGLLAREFRELEERGVRFRFLGSRYRLSDKLLKMIDSTEARTAALSKGTVSLCLNYGGQAELADAIRSMLAAGVKPDDVDPGLISQHLYGPGIPPVDLLLRSSGEQRTSGFMMWRAAYAELYFAPMHWPDFTI